MRVATPDKILSQYVCVRREHHQASDSRGEQVKLVRAEVLSDERSVKVCGVTSQIKTA